jgi:hypothetical protein
VCDVLQATSGRRMLKREVPDDMLETVADRQTAAYLIGLALGLVLGQGGAR